MKLASVLLACNENTKYLDFWPSVRESWRRIVGIPCMMVYVGEQLPAHLYGDAGVIFFRALPGWPTATQAQCVRLLYPALLECDGAVMISDMDMMPLQRRFFCDGFARFEPDQFVSLRGIDIGLGQVYACYVGATPNTWGDLFEIRTSDDVVCRMEDWASRYPADGCHGGHGWWTDQQELFRRVREWQATQPKRVAPVPWREHISRLDRCNPEEYRTWDDQLEARLKAEYYVDFHMPDYIGAAPMVNRVLALLSECF